MEIKILKSILGANDAVADSNAKMFAERGIASINLMSSPGSGKTTLLDKTIAILKDEMKLAVIEGDIQTTMDADRLAKHGVPIVQINTEPFGGDCHLEAGMIAGAMKQMDADSLDFVIVENVGNLVCPAEFKLGVDRDVALLSVTEGEDKPLKYPLMFQTCSLCVITKIDLLPYLDFDMEKVVANVKAVNPKMEIIKLSSKSGEGMDEWLGFLRAILKMKKGSGD